MDRQFRNVLDQLDIEYEKSEHYTIIERVQYEFETYLKANPYDSEIWIPFAIFLTDEPSISHPEKAVEYLQKVLMYDSQNIRSLIILADIQSSNLGFI